MILPPPRAERVNTPWTRKRLSFDPLIELIHDRAQLLPDQRQDPDYSLADAIMSALALFSLKDPSLLAFEARRNDENMKTLFRMCCLGEAGEERGDSLGSGAYGEAARRQ